MNVTQNSDLTMAAGHSRRVGACPDGRVPTRSLRAVTSSGSTSLPSDGQIEQLEAQAYATIKRILFSDERLSHERGGQNLRMERMLEVLKQQTPGNFFTVMASVATAAGYPVHSAKSSAICGARARTRARLLSYLAWAATFLWVAVKVIGSKLNLKIGKSASYTFKYHCIAALYLVAGGFSRPDDNGGQGHAIKPLACVAPFMPTSVCVVEDLGLFEGGTYIPRKFAFAERSLKSAITAAWHKRSRFARLQLFDKLNTNGCVCRACG
jgi:hypothetical protein